MRKAPEGVSEPPPVKHLGEQKIMPKYPSPEEIVSDGTGPSNLDNIFARLEEEEASAQEEAKQGTVLVSIQHSRDRGFSGGCTMSGLDLTTNLFSSLHLRLYMRYVSRRAVHHAGDRLLIIHCSAADDL